MPRKPEPPVTRIFIARPSDIKFALFYNAKMIYAMNCLLCYNAQMIFFKKIFAKNILSLLTRLLFAKRKKKTAKTLLVIRLDGIGDYTLFRNFLQFLRSSDKYGDYNITLLGDKTWSDISEFLDKSYVTNSYGQTEVNFQDPFYALKFLRELSGLSFETLINPVFTVICFYRHFLRK